MLRIAAVTRMPSALSSGLSMISMGNVAAVLARARQLDAGADLLRQRLGRGARAVGDQPLGEALRDDVRDLLPEELVAAIAELLLRLNVDQDDLARLVDHHHGIRRRLQQPAVPALHLRQMFLRVLARRDVLQHREKGRLAFEVDKPRVPLDTQDRAILLAMPQTWRCLTEAWSDWDRPGAASPFGSSRSSILMVSNSSRDHPYCSTAASLTARKRCVLRSATSMGEGLELNRILVTVFNGMARCPLAGDPDGERPDRRGGDGPSGGDDPDGLPPRHKGLVDGLSERQDEIGIGIEAAKNDQPPRTVDGAHGIVTSFDLAFRYPREQRWAHLGRTHEALIERAAHQQYAIVAPQRYCQTADVVVDFPHIGKERQRHGTQDQTVELTLCVANRKRRRDDPLSRRAGSYRNSPEEPRQGIVALPNEVIAIGDVPACVGRIRAVNNTPLSIDHSYRCQERAIFLDEVMKLPAHLLRGGRSHDGRIGEDHLGRLQGLFDALQGAAGLLARQLRESGQNFWPEAMASVLRYTIRTDNTAAVSTAYTVGSATTRLGIEAWRLNTVRPSATWFPWRANRCVQPRASSRRPASASDRQVP